MVRMQVKDVIVGKGSTPSAVVLLPEGKRAASTLPISVGPFEASCIGAGLEHRRRRRPMTHDLLANVIDVLGGKLESVSITRAEGATFFATLDIRLGTGETHHIDARPSDAIALAVRTQVPILATEKLLEQAGLPNLDAVAADERARDAKAFHDFVESLTPDDFKTNRQ